MASSGVFDGEFVQVEGFLQAVQFVDAGVGVSEGYGVFIVSVGAECFLLGFTQLMSVLSLVDISGDIVHSFSHL